MISSNDPGSIRSMFDRLSVRYDLINSVLSLGIHWIWKRRLVSLGASGLSAHARVLDCATGTGDIALLWRKALGRDCQVVATDFSEGMLARARLRFSRLKGVEFEWADVQNLAYESNSFDCASISFGIRNVKSPILALQELARVVRRGHAVMVLEFGQSNVPWVSAFYRLYSQRVLPLIGGWLSGDRQAYRYLNSSSQEFPCGEKFLQLARSTQSFETTEAIPLFGGVAWIYVLRTGGPSSG